MIRRHTLFILLLAALMLAACQSAQGGAAAGAQIGGVEWKLTQLNGSPVLAGRDVTLKIDGAKAGGSSGCNSYGGEVKVDGSQVAFSNLAQTEMACPDPAGIMEQETSFLQALSQASSFTVNGNTLELKNAAGEALLVFSK